MRLGALDLLVLGAYFAGVVGLGLGVARRHRSLDDYVVGGRCLPWWLVLASIVATETSTVTFFSVPGFAFARDLTFLQIPLGYLLGRFLVIAVLLPAYFEGRPVTAYEVLARRFGADVQRASSALFVVTRTLADGLRLFLTAIVLQEVSGIPLPAAVAATGLATIAYTFVGGMRSVLWTDLVQLVVYLAGAALALTRLAAALPGGLGGILSAAAAAGKLRVFDTTLTLSDPYVLWAGLLGGAGLSLGTHGADQLMVQRYLCAPSRRDAARAVWLSGIVVLAQFVLFLVIGIGLWAFYSQHPPTVPFDLTDRVFARFIVEQMPAGVLGLLLGAVFAAAMSTLSSSLNSCATSAATDLYFPWARPGAGEAERLSLTRRLTVVFGLAQIGVGLGGQWLASSAIEGVLAIAGFTTGIVLGVFLLGRQRRPVGPRAALAGLVGGLAVMTTLRFATSLAWPWFALVGACVTFALGHLAEALCGERSVNRRVADPRTPQGEP